MTPERPQITSKAQGILKEVRAHLCQLLFVIIPTFSLRIIRMRNQGKKDQNQILNLELLLEITGFGGYG